MKLELTNKISSALRAVRLNNPVNGEILTAENLSKLIKKNRAWMSQIESQRLKKIRREDIISIYKLVFGIDETDAEYRAELDLIEQSENDLFVIDYNNKQLEEPDSVITSLSFLFENIYHSCKKHFETLTPENQLEYFNRLITMDTQFRTIFEDSIQLVGIPLELLNYAPKDEKEMVLNQLRDIENKCNSYQENKLIIGFIKDSNSILEELNDCKSSKPIDTAHMGRATNFLLLVLSQIIYTAKNIEVIKKISFVNIYINLLKEYNSVMHPKKFFTITNLQDNATVTDISNKLNELQLYLTDADDSNISIRGRLSEYYKDK